MDRKTGKATPRILTLARDLKRRKARERTDLFVAEGIRAVEELVRAQLPVRGALVTATLGDSPRGAKLAAALGKRGVELVTVSEEDFRTAAGTESPQGILAVAEVPDVAIASVPEAALARVLVLDGIQDPGNVGTLIRTAAALGVGCVVALPGTADLWNAKVVRGAAGGHFHVTVTRSELPELLAVLRAHDVPLWAADAAGRDVGAVRPPARVALAVGNEGAGISLELRAAAAELVALPMASGVESLNVGVAAGILIFALRP